MSILKSVPLFGILWIIYNIFAFFVVGPNSQLTLMDIRFKPIMLPSNHAWQPTMHDIVLMIGLLVLYFEIVKSTKTGSTTVVDHTLSTFVFIAYLLEFLMAPIVADSTFVLLGCMSLLDVLAGFTITIVAARRDFSVGGG